LLALLAEAEDGVELEELASTPKLPAITLAAELSIDRTMWREPRAEVSPPSATDPVAELVACAAVPAEAPKAAIDFVFSDEVIAIFGEAEL
jgi:hypothetical protein